MYWNWRVGVYDCLDFGVSYEWIVIELEIVIVYLIRLYWFYVFNFVYYK